MQKRIYLTPIELFKIWQLHYDHPQMPARMIARRVNVKTNLAWNAVQWIDTVEGGVKKGKMLDSYRFALRNYKVWRADREKMLNKPIVPQQLPLPNGKIEITELDLLLDELQNQVRAFNRYIGELVPRLVASQMKAERIKYQEQIKALQDQLAQTTQTETKPTWVQNLKEKIEHENRM